jgi:hypothetical protein
VVYAQLSVFLTLWADAWLDGVEYPREQCAVAVGHLYDQPWDEAKNEQDADDDQ